MKLNLSTILAIAGGLGVFAPDLASISSWLASLGVPWLAYVAKGLGAAALLAASLPRIVTKLRPVLAAADLATPANTTPNAQASAELAMKAISKAMDSKP